MRAIKSKKLRKLAKETSLSLIMNKNDISLKTEYVKDFKGTISLNKNCLRSIYKVIKNKF